MEKGNSWGSSSSKSSNTDSRIKQDVANKYLRLPRYKESTSPRPESRKKPNPQRNRELFDKRPRTRVGAVCEKYRSEIVENPINEPNVKQGSKKINLNHLLNFTLTPSANRDVPLMRKGVYNRNKLPKYNKELFLQANCQFVARNDGDYTIHNKNPDVLVEWSLIEEIVLPSYEVPLCPICLYTPIAAKITRCGHIYCYPCILHYLSLTDRTWQKCPICFDAVHKNELKSVSVKICQDYSVGDEITMCLMKREKNSMCPFPASYNLTPEIHCNVEAADAIKCFQKLLLANKDQIFEIINRERSQLNVAYIQEKDTPEVCFIESALNLLTERESVLLNQSLNISDEDKEKFFGTSFPEKKLPNYVREHNLSTSSTDSQDESNELAPNIIPKNSSFHEDKQVSNESEKQQNICYFYQAEDGQHIYMHTLNIRTILKEYGSLENAPHIIKARIVEIERVSLTEGLRKRLRYLHHLPLTCEIELVELDFSGVISTETLHYFESDIIKRQQWRNRKARDERKREKFIQLEENKKLGKYPEASYNLSSQTHFPSYDLTNDFQSLSLSDNRDASNNILPQETDTNDPDKCDTTLASTSFAQMLKDGSPKNCFHFPKEKTSPLTEKEPQVINSDNEDGVPPPEYRQSFSDAIQAALDSFANADDIKAENQRCMKKKKGKKKLLFTTTMCRNK